MSTTQIDQLARLISSALASDPRFVVISCDATRSFRLDDAKRTFPDQFVEVGAAENSALGIAHGLAQEGYRPLVVGFSSFLVLRGTETIRSLIAYHRSRVCILGGLSGISASHDGYMHQSFDDVGILRAIGGVRIFTPGDAASLQQCFSRALDHSGPSFLRLYRVPIELGEVVTPLCDVGMACRFRSGHDFALLSYGHIAQECVRSAIALQREKMLNGAVYEVFDIAAVTKSYARSALDGFRVVFVVEDHLVESGAGAIWNAEIGSGAAPVRLRGIGSSELVRGGTFSEALHEYGLDASSIKDMIIDARKG